MKNVLVALNIVLLAAVGFLFYKYFTLSKEADSSGKNLVTKEAQAPANGDCRIAYFEMDSVESYCEMVKDVKQELTRKEENRNTELARMDQQIRDKATEYESQRATMTPAQGEMAQQDIFQRNQKLQERKQELDQDYQNTYMRLNTEMKKKIETFLNEYNKNKTYSYIFAYESGLFFYKDSAYNITRDVVNGLNEKYRKEKNK